MTKKFKVGVIGVGFIGPAHMEGIRRQGFEVVAIGEATQELAEQAAERLLVPKAYGDFHDLINDPEIGWDTPIELGQMRCSFRQLVDAKAWDPDWLEVITLFAGQLDDPIPLLELLADPPNDDLLRHRLALAAQCLAEIPEARMAKPSRFVDKIATEAFAFCWEHVTNYRHGVLRHWRDALSALAQVNGRVNGTPILVLQRRIGSSGAVS